MDSRDDRSSAALIFDISKISLDEFERTPLHDGQMNR
jgi:hypothetical protein